MSSSVYTSARFRRQVVTVTAVGMLMAAGLAGHAQTPAGQAPAIDPRFVGAGDRTMILVLVKPDKAADFEAVMAKIKEGIAKPDKADDPNATPEAAKAAAEGKVKRAQWRKMAEGWSVLKVAEPMGGNATYIWNLNPAIDGADYDPTKIIYETFDRAEADALYGKLGGALAGVQKWTVTKLMDIK
jgi:hypothetical protein